MDSEQDHSACWYQDVNVDTTDYKKIEIILQNY